MSVAIPRREWPLDFRRFLMKHRDVGRSVRTLNACLRRGLVGAACAVFMSVAQMSPPLLAAGVDQKQGSPLPAEAPEARAYQRLRVRGNIESMYGPLFRKLGLNADQTAALKELLVERQVGSSDLLASLRRQGLDSRNLDTKSQFDAIMADFRADSDAKLLGLLGADALGALKEYDHRWPQRNTVNVVAQRLAGTVSPLREEQIERLVLALTPAAGEGRALIPTPVGGVMVHISVKAVGDAKEFLDEAQLAQFLALKQEQDARLKLAEATKRAGSAAPSTKAGAP